MGFDEYARVMRIYLARYRLVGQIYCIPKSYLILPLQSIKGDGAKTKKVARHDSVEEEEEEVVDED